MADRTGTGKPIGTVLSDRSSSMLFTFDTTAAVTKGRCVIMSTTHRTVTQSTAVPVADTAAKIIGISTETVASGDECQVCLHGIIIAEAGADVTLGAWMTTDTSGRVTDGVSGMPGTGTTVTAGGAGSNVDGYTAVGICILKDAAASAGDGVGVYVV